MMHKKNSKLYYKIKTNTHHIMNKTSGCETWSLTLGKNIYWDIQEQSAEDIWAEVGKGNRGIEQTT